MTEGRSLAAVVFDMDGVLVDSEPLQEASLAEFLARRGHSLPRDEYAATIGLNHRRFWEVMVERFGLTEPMEACAAEVQRLLLPRLASIPPKPGARELVLGLDAAGVPEGLASSSFRPVVDAIVSAIGLETAFGAIVSGEEVRDGKPAPDIYLLAAERLRVEAAGCVAVEDSPHGIEAAIRAGMTCLGVATAYSTPAELAAALLVVQSLADVTPADLRRLIAAGPPESPRS